MITKTSLPSGGAVAKATIKTGKVAKVIASALGDSTDVDLDLVAGGEPTADGGIVVKLTFYNHLDETLHRMCTRFATDSGSKVVFKEIGGGTGRKLIAKGGVPVACPLDYTDDTYWLCRPGMTGDECFDNDLDATLLLPGGGTSAEAHTGDTDQPYDCFYVYPTVHLAAPAANHHDFLDHTFELDPLLAQAARFTGQCRVFAPLYRQITLPAFADAFSAKFLEYAYRDVKAAWDEYLANHNGGRDVVIIGHSQGTQMLTRLLQEEFDGVPALTSQLIVALMIGGGVHVPVGEVVGGTFASLPLCTTDAETGCVLAYRTYAEGYEPVGGSNVVGPDGNDTACTNPAALGGGEALLSGSYFIDVPQQPIFDVIPDFGFGTAFVKYEDFYAAECVPDDRGASYLRIRPLPGGGDVRTDDIDYDHVALDPGFLGTHVLDYEFAMGDLQSLVATKAAAMP